MKKLLFFVIAFLFLFSGKAQDTFEELINLPEKKLNKAIFVYGNKDWRPDPITGCNLDPDLSKIDIKKVALVSFTISVPDEFHNKYLTEVANDYFVQKLYDLGMDDLKKAFNADGIDLLTVDKMTEQQKAILSGTSSGDGMFTTNLDLKKEKIKERYEKVESKGVSAGSAVPGYKSWMWQAEGAPVSWDMNLYGALCHAMEVDAILFVNNFVTIEKKGLTWTKTIVTMIGRNPIPKIEGRKYPGLSYIYGMPYEQTAISGEVQIADFKKKSIVGENFDGYDKVLGLLGDRMIQSLKRNKQKSIEVAKKKMEKANKKK